MAFMSCMTMEHPKVFCTNYTIATASTLVMPISRLSSVSGDMSVLSISSVPTRKALVLSIISCFVI